MPRGIGTSVSLYFYSRQLVCVVVVAAVAAAATADDDKGQHQLTTFNHQSKVMVGGKTDDSGNVVHQFHGTVSGEQQCCFHLRFFLWRK